MICLSGLESQNARHGPRPVAGGAGVARKVLAVASAGDRTCMADA